VFYERTCFIRIANAPVLREEDNEGDEERRRTTEGKMKEGERERERMEGGMCFIVARESTTRS